LSPLGRAYVPWLLNAPVPASLALALTFFSFRLAEPDKIFFARLSSPTSEIKCPRPSLAVGVLELLDACSGYVSTTDSLGLTSGRFFASGSFLSLTEISTAGPLVATRPLNSAPELPAPC
jgi:hypothetical protein